MYSLDLIKSTKLAQKLGGPPTFHDGFLHSVTINQDTIILDIQILSQNNPLLREDTRVLLKLSGIYSFNLISSEVSKSLLIIHDLEIRKEQGRIHMILESTTGEISEIVFSAIELIEA